MGMPACAGGAGEEEMSTQSKYSLMSFLHMYEEQSGKKHWDVSKSNFWRIISCLMCLISRMFQDTWCQQENPTE